MCKWVGQSLQMINILFMFSKGKHIQYVFKLLFIHRLGSVLLGTSWKHF